MTRPTKSCAKRPSRPSRGGTTMSEASRGRPDIDVSVLTARGRLRRPAEAGLQAPPV